jgi:hypothetical protein
MWTSRVWKSILPLLVFRFLRLKLPLTVAVAVDVANQLTKTQSVHKASSDGSVRNEDVCHRA